MTAAPSSAWRRARPLIVALALLISACSPGLSISAAARTGDPPGSFAPLVRRVLPSVVNIAVTDPMPNVITKITESAKPGERRNVRTT